MESYSHIDLTEEETDLAIIAAKQKKETAIAHQQSLERIEKNRKSLTSDVWDLSVTENYMHTRAGNLFEGKFVWDKDNSAVFLLLCRYFSNDKDFVSAAQGLGIYNPSLEKGILLAGTFGTGKTWLMNLFQKNKKACYALDNAKEISKDFQISGETAVDKHTVKLKNPINDASVFYQPFCGLCIDDLGSEDVKNNFGNKSNVIGDLIEMRYAKGNAGVYLHATTNMSAKGLNEFYGGRVVSRIREVFNIIDLKGNDRRK